MESFDIVISAGLRDNPVAQLMEELGIKVKYITLREGEFVISGKIGVKYFTCRAFLKEIADRRLNRSIIEFKRQYAQPIVIVESEPHEPTPVFDLAAIQTAEIFTSLVNQVPIFITRNENETAQLLFLLGANINFISGGDRTPAEIAAETTSGDKRRELLTKIPEIGPQLAKTLLEHFGTLSKLFSAEVDDLRKVKGVGPSRARKIHSFLNSTKEL